MHICEENHSHENQEKNKETGKKKHGKDSERKQGQKNRLLKTQNPYKSVASKIKTGQYMKQHEENKKELIEIKNMVQAI